MFLIFLFWDLNFCSYTEAYKRLGLLLFGETGGRSEVRVYPLKVICGCLSSFRQRRFLVGDGKDRNPFLFSIEII